MSGNDGAFTPHPIPATEPDMDDNKGKALAAALAQIEKQFGKGSIMKMGEAQIQNDLQVDPDRLARPRHRAGRRGPPARSCRRDLRTGIIRARPRSACRSSPRSRRPGGTAAYIDAENALDPVYAGKLGVSVGELLISQPDTGEQGLEIADMLVRSGGVDIIVIDSVAALVPKAEIEGEMGDQLPGLQARLMSQALRKLASNIKRANVLVIFINQIRMKIGVMFGNPETTTGGNALKFYASVRLDIRRIGAIKRGEEMVGNETRVKVVKNKVSPPFREALFDILYGEGISREGEIIELGVNHRIVEKSGAWYAYAGDKIGQGKDNAREFLKRTPGDRDGNRNENPRSSRNSRTTPHEGRRQRGRRRIALPPLPPDHPPWAIAQGVVTDADARGPHQAPGIASRARDTPARAPRLQSHGARAAGWPRARLRARTWRSCSTTSSAWATCRTHVTRRRWSRKRAANTADARSRDP